MFTKDERKMFVSNLTGTFYPLMLKDYYLQMMNVNCSCPIGHEQFTFIFCKHYWDPKDERSLLTLIGS